MSVDFWSDSVLPGRKQENSECEVNRGKWEGQSTVGHHGWVLVSATWEGSERCRENTTGTQQHHSWKKHQFLTYFCIEAEIDQFLEKNSLLVF